MIKAMIIALMEIYPNDADLGKEIRKIAIKLKNKKDEKRLDNTK